MVAKTPSPPYYAVIFTSVLSGDIEGYEDMADEMFSLAQQQEGFLGAESARNDLGITVCYWASLDAIAKWKASSRHLVAQKYGREKWYRYYKVRICLVQHDYEL